MQRELELPGDWAIWMGIVRTKVPRLNPRVEVVTQRRDGFTDFLNRFFNAFGDSASCPLSFRGFLAAPAAETNGGR